MTTWFLLAVIALFVGVFIYLLAANLRMTKMLAELFRRDEW